MSLVVGERAAASARRRCPARRTVPGRHAVQPATRVEDVEGSPLRSIFAEAATLAGMRRPPLANLEAEGHRTIRCWPSSTVGARSTLALESCSPGVGREKHVTRSSDRVGQGEQSGPDSTRQLGLGNSASATRPLAAAWCRCLLPRQFNPTAIRSQRARSGRNVPLAGWVSTARSMRYGRAFEAR
jgi:hypothetical protein